MQTVLCACGCGGSIELRDKWGRSRRFVSGHNRRGQPGRRPGPIAPRFWAKVVKGPDCWEWIGYRQDYGYGEMYVPGIGPTRAHRVSWELHYGAIPVGLNILHHCDNPPCVRPDHLFLGTKADNSLDMVTKGRHVPAGVKGERNPHARLTAEIIRDIRARRLQGETYASIGASYNLSRGTVWGIVVGRAWAHVI